jgi:hypothetical protein
MASEARIGITTDTKHAEKGIMSVRGLFQGLQAEAKKSFLTGVGLSSGVAAFNALSAAVHKVADFVGEAVQSASNLEQATGAIESVFGSAAIEIKRFGLTAADSFGLSRREVAELGAVVGAQLQGMGFNATEAASKTILLEQRAADLAATFGGPVSNAVQAISALLRGERDPIERYGVSIKEADVQSRILALGLDTSTTEAKKQATAIATLDLLLQQTASSAGAFAREEETLAGQQARMNAELENAHAQIGQGLMPAWTALSGVLRDIINPVANLSTELEINALEAEAAANASQTTANNWTAMGRKALETAPDIERIGFSMELTAQRLKDALDRAKNDVNVGMDQIVSELTGAEEAWERGWDDIIQITEDDAGTVAEIAAIKSRLASQEFRDGITSGNPAIRAAFQAWQATAEERLFALQHGVDDIALATGTSYASALASTKTQAGLAAHTIRENVTRNLAIPGTWTIGKQVGTYWSNGLASGLASGVAAAKNAANQAKAAMALAKSPWYVHAKEIGTKVGEAWGSGLSGSLGKAVRGMPDLDGALPRGGGVGTGAIGGGGRGTTIQLILDGRVLAEVVDRNLYYRTGTRATLPRT